MLSTYGSPAPYVETFLGESPPHTLAPGQGLVWQLLGIMLSSRTKPIGIGTSNAPSAKSVHSGMPAPTWYSRDSDAACVAAAIARATVNAPWRTWISRRRSPDTALAFGGGDSLSGALYAVQARRIPKSVS